MSDDQLHLTFDDQPEVDQPEVDQPEVDQPEVDQPEVDRPDDRPEVDRPSPTDRPFHVEVTRSKRRKRSVGAQLVGDTLRVAIPSWMSRTEEAHWVAEMSRRFARKMSNDRIDLRTRANRLANRHRLPRPTEIRWATDMTMRWGSCTPDTGTIRISDRIATYPDWVVDYVIVHELAHLVVGGHGADFWELVARYPRSERAIGYLIAKAGDDGAGDGTSD